MSDRLAERLKLGPGDTLAVVAGSRRETLKVVGLFTSPRGLYPLEGAVLLMDIARPRNSWTGWAGWIISTFWGAGPVCGG
jgi:hypothetical protein